MKSRILLALSLVLMAAPLFAQDAPKQRDADRVMDKIARAQILYEILPLLLTKEQIHQILPVIERARDNVRKTLTKEDDLMRGVERLTDEVYKRAVEKNILPTDVERDKMAKALAAIRIGREIIAGENVELVMPAFDKIVNKGQRKVAANSINVKYYIDNAKPEKMTDEEKERVFIRYVLLDPAAYDLLRDLEKSMR